MPVVPGYVPFTLLVVLVAAAASIWVLMYARRRRTGLDALLICSRCTRLHERAEVVARAADAVATGALAFLVALPFVAAGYEGGFTFWRVLLGCSAVLAVLAVAAEADFFVRAAGARLLPNFTWKADAARLVGGGARWLGVIFALYLFQHPDMPSSGVAGLFGSVGPLLASALSSTASIYAAAALLVIAAIAALAARWLVPFALNSLPLAMAAPRGPMSARHE
jgi:hypothetical protein